jgi:hypothetical protein
MNSLRKILWISLALTTLGWTLPVARVDSINAPSDTSKMEGSKDLFGDCAYSIPEGQGQLSQKSYLISMISMGLTNHITLEFATVLPYFFMNEGGPNGMGGIKFGYMGNSGFGIQSGLWEFFGGGSKPFHLLYAGGTIGSPTTYASLNYIQLDPRLFTHYQLTALRLSFFHRMSAKYAIISDNFYIPTSKSKDNPKMGLVDLGGLRYSGKTWHVDALMGVIGYFEKGNSWLYPTILPMLSFTRGF